MEKIFINNIEFDCFNTYKNGTYPDDVFFTIVDLDTFVRVKPLLDNINSIVSYSSDNLLKYDTKEYNTYSSIQYQDKDVYTVYTINNVSVDTFKISFKRTDIESEVNRISKLVDSTVNEDEMSLEEFKEYYKEKLSKICNTMIYNGTDVQTSYGLEHFTFNSEDQKDLMTYFIAAFMTKLPQYYHPSTTPPTSCRPYSYIDIVTIYLTLNMHLLYHMTYANQLYIKLYNCTSKEDVKNIVYGMELDESAQNVVNGALNNCQDTINYLQTIFTTNGDINEQVVM